MRISDWSSDVCSSDLPCPARWKAKRADGTDDGWDRAVVRQGRHVGRPVRLPERQAPQPEVERQGHQELPIRWPRITQGRSSIHLLRYRSEEHTSELQPLMRISYAVFCLKKKNTQ